MATRRKRFTGSPAVPAAEVAAHVLGDGENLGPSRREAARRFPVRLTRHYLDLVQPRTPDDPIRRIAFPEPAELESHPADLADPVGERHRTPVPYVVRKHSDRAILLTTSRCHVYCRFCFRRSFPDGEHRDPTPQVFEQALQYLAGEPQLREVILSGGDPLALPDDELGRIVTRLAAMPQLTQLRLHTRAPVHDPGRVTPALIAALTSRLPLWVVLHFNHPREVTNETARIVDLFLRAGMPVLNQTVLLAGVNDNPDTLELLMRTLVGNRIKPYYLHHPDRVPGARSFYVEIDRGRALYAELRRRVSGGIALPAYVIDHEDGSGKFPVEST